MHLGPKISGVELDKNKRCYVFLLFLGERYRNLRRGLYMECTLIVKQSRSRDRSKSNVNQKINILLKNLSDLYRTGKVINGATLNQLFFLSIVDESMSFV